MLVEPDKVGEEPIVFLYEDGLARFATQPYRGQQPATSPDGGGAVGGGGFQYEQHLTNYSLQTGDASFASLVFGDDSAAAGDFKESTDEHGHGGVDAAGRIISHKWSADAAMRFAAETCGVCTAPPSWDAVGAVVSEVIGLAISTDAARKQFSEAAAGAAADGGEAAEDRGGGREGGSCGGHDEAGRLAVTHAAASRPRQFELLGVDVIFDAAGRAWLLELQRKPSLDPSSALDLRVPSAFHRKSWS